MARFPPHRTKRWTKKAQREWEAREGPADVREARARALLLGERMPSIVIDWEKRRRR